jgi:hypothetical protein
MEEKSNRKNNNQLYFLVVDGKKTDPLTIDQLMVRRLYEDDLVWREGLENWVKAKDLEDLSDIVIFYPPPVPIYENLFLTASKNSILSNIKTKRIFFIFILITIGFVFIFFRESNESKIVQHQPYKSSQTLDTVFADSPLKDESYSNKVVPTLSNTEKKSKISLPKNYYLSNNLKTVYVFDDENKFWWFKSLIDDPSEVIPILTKAEIDFVMNSELKIEINGWHIQTIDFAVRILNEKYNKQGRVYQPK